MVALQPAPSTWATRWRLRRWAAVGLAVLSLTTLLVVVPAPQWAMAEEMGVRTVHVDLVRSSIDRSAQAVATAGLETAEAQHLLDARRDLSRLTTGVRRAAARGLGVTVDAAPDGPVLVRARVAGSWSPWFEVPFVAGEAPDLDPGDTAASPVLQSEMVWLGEADAYEIDAPRTTPSLDVHEVVVERTTRSVQLGGAAGALGAPSIRSRASWGARPPQETPSITADLKLAIVHHTVSGNGYSASQVPAILRSIQAYHQDSRGFGDIAYNFIVDRFGVIWEGRAGGTTNVVVGGHSQGFNAGAVGVVALGDYRTAAVNSSMVESISRVIAWKLALHRVDPSSTVPFTSAGSAKYAEGTTVTLRRIVGHDDVQATDCPGTNLKAKIPAIRQRVAQLVPAYQAGLNPLLLDPDATGDGLTDPFEYRPGAGADVHWQATASGQLLKGNVNVSGAYRPAVGDFDGNGRDDIFWHGTGSTSDSIWWWGPGGHTGEPMPVAGSYVPIVGDFDGNGVDDIFWYATGIAPDSVWYFSTNRQHRSVRVDEDLITGVPLVGDLDGEGRDEVFFYGPGTEASDRLWWSLGQTWQVMGKPVAGYYKPAVHDANGDGRADITWLAPGTTSSTLWTWSTLRQSTSVPLNRSAPSGSPQVGDFDGDGREDLLIVAAGSPSDAAWYYTPAGVDVRAVSVGGTYAIATGPMDGAPLLGTATDDVLFVSNGKDYLWRGQSDRTFLSTTVG